MAIATISSPGGKVTSYKDPSTGEWKQGAPPAGLQAPAEPGPRTPTPTAADYVRQQEAIKGGVQFSNIITPEQAGLEKPPSQTKQLLPLGTQEVPVMKYLNIYGQWNQQVPIQQRTAVHVGLQPQYPIPAGRTDLQPGEAEFLKKYTLINSQGQPVIDFEERLKLTRNYFIISAQGEPIGRKAYVGFGNPKQAPQFPVPKFVGGNAANVEIKSMKVIGPPKPPAIQPFKGTHLNLFSRAGVFEKGSEPVVNILEKGFRPAEYWIGEGVNAALPKFEEMIRPTIHEMRYKYQTQPGEEPFKGSLLGAYKAVLGRPIFESLVGTYKTGKTIIGPTNIPTATLSIQGKETPIGYHPVAKLVLLTTAGIGLGIKAITSAPRGPERIIAAGEFGSAMFALKGASLLGGKVAPTFEPAIRIGEATPYKGGVAIAGRGVIGLGDKGITLGTPKLPIKALVEEGQFFEPSSAFQKNVYLKSILDYPTAEVVGVKKGYAIIRLTHAQKSAFVEAFTRDIKTLSPKGVGVVLNFARKEGAEAYGSFAAVTQMPKDLKPKPGDIDLNLRPGITPEQAALKAQALVKQLRAVGEDVRISPGKPTLIEARNKPGSPKLYSHAVDIHYKGMPEPYTPSEFTFGFKLGQPTIKREGISVMRLSEQGIRNYRSTAVAKREGGISRLGPLEKELKNIARFPLVQETLFRSMESGPFGILKAPKAALGRAYLKEWITAQEKIYGKGTIRDLVTQAEKEPTKVLLYSPEEAVITRSPSTGFFVPQKTQSIKAAVSQSVSSNSASISRSLRKVSPSISLSSRSLSASASIRPKHYPSVSIPSPSRVLPPSKNPPSRPVSKSITYSKYAVPSPSPKLAPASPKLPSQSIYKYYVAIPFKPKQPTPPVWPFRKESETQPILKKRAITLIEGRGRVKKKPVPLADWISKTVTEIQTKRPGLHPKETPGVTKAFREVMARGGGFFPTAEMLKGKVKKPQWINRNTLGI